MTPNSVARLRLGVGSLHKFVTRREGEVERLGAAENIAVLITDGGLQAVETRRGAAFEVDLDALLERRRAENVARQVALARVERLRRIGRSAMKETMSVTSADRGCSSKAIFALLKYPSAIRSE